MGPPTHPPAQDEALRLAREDCKALSRLRRALSKPCHYRTVAPPGFRNEFHWTLSGRDFFKRSSAPKVEEPQESKSSHYTNDEDFDEYTTGWRFLDVSEDAERQAQAAADNQKLRSIRRRLRTSCQYSEIAPLKNQFHWCVHFSFLPSSVFPSVSPIPSLLRVLCSRGRDAAHRSQRGRCHFRRRPKASKSLSESTWAEYRISSELRAESLRYIAQQLVLEAMDKEQRWRVREHGDVLLESPCCEAAGDELLLRADAKEASAVARAWRCTRIYSDIKHVPHPVRPHFLAFARNIFTTNQFAKPKSGMVQCLAADDGLNLEATQDVLQVRADARAFSQVAHAFSATRKYSAVCPVKHMPAPLRTHFAASSRNVFTTTQFAESSESGMVQCLAADDGLDLEATQDVLQLRADAKAFSQVAHAFSATRKYSTICPVPKPIRTHFSAFGRNMFTTNQFMRGKDEKAKQQQQQQQQQQGPSKPSSIKTGSIKFDAMDKKTQQTPLGSPESIMGFPEGFEEEQMPELAI